MRVDVLIKKLHEFPSDSQVSLGESDLVDDCNGLVIETSDGSLPAGDSAINFIEV